MSSLKGGRVSIVFHVEFDESDEAFRVHDYQGDRVRLELHKEID